MAQISYGTITITDTNDVESIVIEYNRNQSTTTPPAQTDSGWSTNRPTWAQGYYIWQRTRTHKSGTQASEDILGNAVCITGSTGQSGTPGKGITGIETLYATNNSTTTAPTSGWQSQPPTYNSSNPKYWVKVTTTYNVDDPTVVTYLDNGITDAMATAAAANSSATEALSKTQAKYATSSTEATTQAKVAVFNPAVTTWSLFNGAEIFVKFTNENNVANPTLSVKPSSSGSGTAAKTIRDSDGNALDSKFYWRNNSLVHFVYDGTYWRILDIVTTAKYNSMVSDIDGITQTVGKIELHDVSQYATSSTAASTQNKVATITPAVTGWELYTGATITVKFTNANTHATPNLNINNTGAKGIRTYSGGTLSEGEYKWKAGDVFTFTYNGTYWLMQDGMVRLRENEATIQNTANNVLIKATENDTTAAQGGQHLIQSLINVAPDGVTIAANKVEIDGSAIFSAISSDVNAAVSNVMTTGLGMKVNYSSFTTANTGECYFHGFNTSNVEADVDGWVIWNGEKLTITKGMWINPNGTVPVNTPIFHVFRTSTSPYHSDVWWDSSLSTWRGYAYTTDKVPGTKANWTWNEATDCILAVYIATGNEEISSAQLFTTPKKFSELSNPNDIHNIVDTSINSLEIGGRNLVKGTSDEWYSLVITDGQNRNINLFGLANVHEPLYIEDIPDIKAGDKIQVSFDIKFSENWVATETGTKSSTVQGNKNYNSTPWASISYTGGNKKTELETIMASTSKEGHITTWFLVTQDMIDGTYSGQLNSNIRFDYYSGTVSVRRIMVEKGDKATSWAPAPEDMVAQEQRIYYRTAITTPLPSAPSTWVASTVTANNTWTTKRMQYDRDYPYLFTCIQSISVGGAISNTDILLDDTTTVIDGGHIITGTVDANQIAANAVTADKIATDAIHSRTYNSGTGIYSTEGMGIDLTGNGSIKSPNFAIDANGNAYFNGKLTATSLVIAPGTVVEGDTSQMLSDVYAPSLTKIDAKYNRYFSDASNTSTVCSFVSAGNEVLPDPNAEYFVRIKNTELNKYRALCFYGSANYENAIGMVVGETYKVSCWVRQLEGSSNFFINLGGLGGTQYTDTTFVPTAEWQKYEKIFTFSDLNEVTSTVWSRLYFYNRAGAEINGAGTGIGQIDMCSFKLERISAITASGRNLCLRSADYSGWGSNNGTTFNGNIITFPTVTTNTWREAWQNNNIPYSVVRNQKITVTYKVKGTANDLIVLNTSLGLVASETSNSRLKYVNKYHRAYANGKWQTVAFSVYVNDYIFASGSGTPDYDNCYFTVRVGAGAGNDDHSGFQLKEIMVALGSDPCAWSPAPEDGVIYTNESIDAIEIGGKNLHKHSEKLDSAWTTEQGTIDTTTGIATLARTGTGNCRIYQMPANGWWTWEAGVEYTASIEAKASENGVVLSFDCNSSGTKTFSNRQPALTTEWKRYACTFTITGTTSGGSMSYTMNTTTTGKTIYLRKPMLERGNKPSDWAPAPEDEANARKLLIREVNSGSTQGIEVGYENGSYKAFINAEGSFDVVNAAGETVASFGTEVSMKSSKMDSVGTTTSTMTIKPDGMIIDQDLPDAGGTWDERQRVSVTPYGISLVDYSEGDSIPRFALDQYVTGVWGTPLVRDWETMPAGNMDGCCYVGGYVTGSSKKLRFTMPLTSPISYRSKLTFDYLRVTVRQDNKYLLGDADTPFSIPVSDSDKFSFETYDTGVNILYNSSSAFSGAINNAPVGIYVEYSMYPEQDTSSL